MPPSSAEKSKSDYGPPLASLALALSKQKWSELSMNEDPTVGATPELDILVERVTALLLVRIVAVISAPGTFPDTSTTMICTTAIGKKKSSWPKVITPVVFEQLSSYVRRIMSGYKEVPYHNREHAYHVILSVNKLLDMMFCCYTNMEDGSEEAPKKFRPPPSFGLRNDPMAQFALIFAAMIHDVEHQGLANRQLASENDRLAVLYNDQSIAENWSLYIGFSELLQDEFVDLRRVLFGENPDSDEYTEKYHGFRKMVVTLVLATDLASPERTQVGKSKWKEAFGEPHETVEAKLKEKLRRESNYSQDSSDTNPHDASSVTGDDDNIQLFQPTRRWPRESDTNEVSASLRSSISQSESGGPTGNITNNPRFASVEEEYEDSVSGTPEVSLNNDEEKKGSAVADMIGSMHSLQTAPPQVELCGTPLGRRKQGGLDLLNQLPDISGNRNSIFTSSSLSISNHELQLPSADRSNSMKGVKSLNQFLTRSHSSKNFASRVSRDGGRSGRFRQRLGILRTVDLGGETLETYSRHDRVSSSQSTVAFTVADHESDEPDELKMTVVMEAIMAAADVAHNLQSWDLMLVWSRRLYFELRRAHAAGRGVDVSPNWFENQIGFLESYVLPLARRLEDTGVWGDEDTLPGISFARTVEALRDEWFEEGYEFTKELIEQGNQIFEND